MECLLSARHVPLEGGEQDKDCVPILGFPCFTPAVNLLSYKQQKQMGYFR